MTGAKEAVAGAETPVLETARLMLRPLGIDDADALFALRSDPRVMRYWSHPPWTERPQAAEYLSRLAREAADASSHSWAVAETRDGPLIGTASLFAISRAHRRAEIGYSLAADRWSRGYAREMLRATIAFAFGRLDLERLEADIDPRNERSCRLVEALGFAREGLLRARWRVAGEVTDSVIYGLLRDEFGAA